MNIKEQSLRQALEIAGCQELPKAFNENGLDFWMKAIGLVKKRNGTQSYCLLEHRPDGIVEYKQDFGLVSPIAGLLSVHPYIFLDKTSHYPTHANRELLLDALSRGLDIDRKEIEAYSEERINACCIELAIRRQEIANDIVNNPLNESAELIEREDVNDDTSLQAEFNTAQTADEDGMITLLSAEDIKDSEGNIIRKTPATEKIDGGNTEFDDIVSISAQSAKESEKFLKPIRNKVGRPKKVKAE